MPTETEPFDTARVRIRQGALVGVRRPGSTAFLGIPFAQPPVGRLRFAAPVPADGWDGVRDATRHGPTPQRRPFAAITMIPEPSIPGEDTLNVNVFTPDPAARLPVLVWIHGGGFKAGSPASPWYDGAAFNRHGVVTVTLSYRLGFDGFGALDDAPANRGLRDLLLGLTWVQENIAAFGGDPTRVTIGGQSAGGGAVMALLTCPAARGLFHAAISASGALDSLPHEQARGYTQRLAELAGVPATREALAALGEDRVLDLEAAVEADLAENPTGTVDLARWVEARLAGRGDLELLPYRPEIDGDLLPGPVEQAVAAGVTDAVPLLIGATAHEFTRVDGAFGDVLGRAGVGVLRERLGPLADRYLAAHADLAGHPAALYGQLVTEATFRRPVVTWADGRARGRTWVYDLRRPGPSGLALHCSDLPFFWHHLDAPRARASIGRTPPRELADVMHGDWVRFITDHEAPWPAWGGACLTRVYRDPTSNETGSVETGYEVARYLIRPGLR